MKGGLVFSCTKLSYAWEDRELFFQFVPAEWTSNSSSHEGHSLRIIARSQTPHRFRTRPECGLTCAGPSIGYGLHRGGTAL